LASRRHSGGGEIACTGQVGQIATGSTDTTEKSLRPGNDAPLLRQGYRAINRSKFFVGLGDASFAFPVKKIFVRVKNKNSFFIHFFLVGFEGDF